MIKANELRIGNHIILNNVQTTLVPRDFQRYCKSFGVFEEFDPIPLTEDWLLKFGFEKEIDEFDIFSIHNSQYYIQHYKNGKCIFVYSPINELNPEDEENVIFLQIKHVHQLQNLYFALTGEELTIK